MNQIKELFLTKFEIETLSGRSLTLSIFLAFFLSIFLFLSFFFRLYLSDSPLSLALP